MIRLLKLLAISTNILVVCVDAFGGSDAFHGQLQKYCESRTKSCDQGTNNNSTLSPITDAQYDAIVGSSCMLYYSSNKCEEAKSGLRAGERGDIISCDRNKICDGQPNNSDPHCELDGFTVKNISVSFGVGTLAGAAAYVGGPTAGAMVGIPFLVYAASQTEEQCAQDMKYKKMAITLHNLSLLPDETPVDFNGKDKALLDLPCSVLERHLRGREDVIIQKRIEKQKWSLEKTKVQSTVGEALLKSYGKCISEKARERRFCSMISSVVAGALSGLPGAVVGRAGTGAVVNWLKPAAKVVPTAEVLANAAESAPSEASTQSAKSLSNDHSAATDHEASTPRMKNYSKKNLDFINDFAKRGIVTQADVDHLLATGDISKFWDLFMNEKMTEPEIEGILSKFRSVNSDVGKPLAPEKTIYFKARGDPTGQRSKVIVQERLSFHGDNALALIDPKSKMAIGLVEFVVHGDTVSIDMIRVDKLYQGAGYPDVLLQQLMEKLPNIKKVVATLAEDNEASLVRGLKSQSSTTTLDEAVKRTFAYQSASKLGFKNIKIEETEDGYQFSAERP